MGYNYGRGRRGGKTNGYLRNHYVFIHPGIFKVKINPYKATIWWLTWNIRSSMEIEKNRKIEMIGDHMEVLN